MPGKLSGRYWLAFIIRRISRIFPALLAIAFLMWCIDPLYPLAGETLNLFKFWKDILAGKNQATRLWVINAELKCYLFFIWFSLFLHSIPNRRSLFLAMLIAVFALSMYYTQHSNYYFIFMLPYFIGGMLAGYIKKNYAYPTLSPLYANLFTLLCVSACIGALLYFPEFTQRRTFKSNAYQIYKIDLLIMLVPLTVWSISHASQQIGWLFSNALANFLGNISYSIFLIHPLVFVATSRVPFSSLEKTMFIFSLMVIVSWVFYILIENPATQAGKQWARRIERRNPQNPLPRAN